jgi:CRISPR-associated protein Csx10
MYNLLIELQSPVCVGSGGPGPGYVDRDVIFDASGLPYIPARRVKGLLHDAFRDVAASLVRRNPKLDLSAVEGSLFGQIGDQSPGALHFRNALICDPRKVKPEPHLPTWLASVTSRGLTKNSGGETGILHREEVLEAYTETRRQTRIDRSTGTAEENTLRMTRSLRKGLKFCGALTATATLSAGAEHLLALSATALQQMGSSRTRGLGQVRCSIWRDDQELTAAALAALRADALGETRVFAVEKREVPASLEPANEPGLLRFRLSLTQPAIFPTLAGDPNMVASLEYIPGASLQGWLAWKFLERHRTEDERFLELFCRGRLRFLPAYLEIPDSNTGEPVRSMPVPFCLRREKKDPDVYRNLLASDDDWPEIRRFEDKWTTVGDALYRGELKEAEVATEMQYHHWRPSSDRRIGRAVGEEQGPGFGIEKGREGSVFTYEQIKPGASFIGAIEGDRAALEYLQQLLGSHLSGVVLGRSRSSQYGGDANWEWLDRAPMKKSETGWLGFAASFQAEDQVLALALSPLLTVNSNGHPAAEFPLAKFQDVSGLTVTIAGAAFTRTEWVGGYLSHQRLPRQQMPAIKPGSVFQLKLVKTYQAEELRAAADRVMAASFGVRAEQGYGRMALLPFSGLQKQGVVRRYSTPHPEATTLKDQDSAEWKLALRIYQQRLGDLVRDDSLDVASRGQIRYKSLKPSLLFRLAEVAATHFGELRRELGKFRRQARDQMDSCRIYRKPFNRQPESGRSLEEFVLDVAEDAAQYYKSLLDKSYSPQGWNLIFGQTNPLAGDKDFSNRLLKAYIITFLKGLAWRVRADRKKDEKQEIAHETSHRGLAHLCARRVESENGDSSRRRKRRLRRRR